MMTQDEKTLLLLSLAKGMTSDKLDRLIGYYGSVNEALLYLDSPDFIYPKLVSGIKRSLDRDADVIIRDNQSKGITVLTAYSQDFPSSLFIEPHPYVLYVKGDVSLLNGGGVSIIGSRVCTTYGLQVASLLGTAAGKAGITVISGGARGIDTAALTACLDSDCPAIAVLGCGLDIVYPPENAALFDRISSCGALVSEYPLGTPAYASNFPARNRIISALGDLLAVIEASIKSGTNSTVRWAQQQGKEVACVPGSIISEQSQGTNKLIKEGAHIITCPNDLLEFFGKKQSATVKKSIKLTPEESEIINILKKEAQLSLDELTQKCNNSASKVAACVTMLELKGILLRKGSTYYLNASLDL